MYAATELRENGYRPGPPSRQAEIDDKPIAEYTCPVCERDTMQYRPWSRKQPYGYIAICVCPRCGHEEEF